MGRISGFFAMPHPPIVIPEVGRGEERKIKDTTDACYKIAEEIVSIEPDTIIIVTSHGPLFRDAISLSYENAIDGDLRNFAAPQVKFSLNIDIALTDQIINYAQKENISTVKITGDFAYQYGLNYELDHGTMVPLYFINKKFTDYKLVHITYGLLPKIQLYKFGMCIKKAVEDMDVDAVFIASGDLSHRLSKDGPYEYSPYGKKFDEELITLLQAGDVAGVFNMDETTVKNAGECGLRSYYIMLGAMDGNEIRGELLAYEGTFGVGYMTMKFSVNPTGRDTLSELAGEIKEKHLEKIREEKDLYIRLARESLTHYIVNGDYLEPPSYVPEEMLKNRRGVFVSIKKNGNLRGCIGTIRPVTENIAQEIIRNAVEAGVYDPRFSPVEEDELPELEFSVDVLTEPVKANKEELDPKKYGVIVRSGHKTGVLLPNLEGVDTVEEQLRIALQKAGISPDEDYDIEKFEVIRHEHN